MGKSDKNKTAHSLLEALDSILSKGRKPEKLRTEKGTEFLNKSFHNYGKKKSIHFYTASNEPNASVVEQVNQALKSKLFYYFRSVNCLCYIYVLQGLVYSYNNTYHRSIEHHQQLIKQSTIYSTLLQKTSHSIIA